MRKTKSYVTNRIIYSVFYKDLGACIHYSYHIVKDKRISDRSCKMLLKKLGLGEFICNESWIVCV